MPISCQDLPAAGYDSRQKCSDLYRNDIFKLKNDGTDAVNDCKTWWCTVLALKRDVSVSRCDVDSRGERYR